MEVESKFSKVAPPIFDGEIYDLRAVRVGIYKYMFVCRCLKNSIFIGIVTHKTVKIIWNYIKEKYEGDERI
ncbi:hypothetical protein MTR_4g101700 [Medicago truncatula]|uniref:Uncharacterized protein n=1 Tax=Medicago truncatula TaxID=3880 RepID=G7JK49_MEDTR|nr:hypothetical protein MTR_4g101700 [Medicago truncatula]